MSTTPRGHGSRPHGRHEFHRLDDLAVSGQRHKMSEIGANDTGGGVHLGGRERIDGHDGTLGFDRAHEMIRFVIRPIALIASGMDMMEDHLGPGAGLLESQMRVGTVGVTGGHPKVVADKNCVLQLSGNYSSAEIPKAVEYLKEHFRPREHFWYGRYYASHAMHQVGGQEWHDWYAKISTLLLAELSQSGDWGRSNLDSAVVGSVYQTAIATIILSVPAQYLPFFQN